jgi:lipopolysaccharide transport system permease protein
VGLVNDGAVADASRHPHEPQDGAPTGEPLGQAAGAASADVGAGPGGQPSRVTGATIVISPHRGWFEWRLRELWRYRDLVGLFVWRDFVSVYKQTVLGPAWHVIQPLLTTATFTIIFARVAGLSTDGVPPFLFYMAGVVPWNYFAACLTNTSRTFIGNTNLLGKVYFHRLAIPVSVVISNLISFGIQLGIFLAVLVLFMAGGAGVEFTRWMLLAPVFVVMLAGYGLGAGIIVSALTTRYRDLAYLVAFGIQLAMYVTPVIYPLSSVPERHQWLLLLNPLTPVIEGLRLGFLGVGLVTLPQVFISFGVMGLLLIVALMLFSRVEQTFMDTV